MPKIVDHAERRAELLDALWRVVRRDGLEGATVRAIASEAGYSTGVLTHYFRDKDEILSSALTLFNERMEARILDILERSDGLAALNAVLLQSLPLDAERRRGLHLEVSMWGRAMVDDAARRAHRRWYDLWEEVISLLLGAAVRDGDLPPDLDVETAALTLVALVDGLVVAALMHPTRITRQRIEAIVSAQIAALPTFTPRGH